MSDSAPRAASDLEVEQEVRQKNDEWVKALVRRDAETLDRIMADDFFFAYPMEGDDKEQFIGDVTSGQVNVESLIRDNVFVRVFGHAAVLTGHDTARWSYQGRDFSGSYKTMHVYALRDGEWRLVAVQACPIN